MYNLNELRIGMEHPNLACREINRRFYNAINGKKYNEKGDNILDECWDVLLILDACRKDMFLEHCDIDGEVSTKVSKGSNTKEFLYGNFNNRKLFDTIYTTANPQFQKHAEEIDSEFYKINNIWDSNLWDKDIGTVHPSDVTDVSKKEINEHPNKRHIVHYLQPHYPFINTELEDIGLEITRDKSEGFDIWGLQMRGELNLSKEQINKAYYKNLEIVLGAVKDLLDEIPGKIVITSDHGNMVGERSYPIPIKEWGHPSGIYTPELIEVPWLIVKNGERPEIHAEEPAQIQGDVDNGVVEDRLKDLGYV